MSKYNSLENILAPMLVENDELCLPSAYDVGERTIWVNHNLYGDEEVQAELEFLEEVLIQGGYSGAVRIELNIKDRGHTKAQRIDLYIIKIARHHTATSEQGTQRVRGFFGRLIDDWSIVR